MRVGKISVRREVFGATVFDVNLARRTYVTTNEFAEIQRLNYLPDNLRDEIQASTNECLISEPQWLPAHNFSAPDKVFFEVTRACNIRCTHCFNNSGHKLNDELTHAERLEVIQDLRDCGVQEIRFTGGEPLALPGIHDLIRRTGLLGFRVSIGTNAMLVGKAEAQKLAEGGLHSAIVSIDGTELVHDRIRGEGSFSASMTGIKHLMAAGINVRVNTVVMKSNIHDIYGLVRHFFECEIGVFLRRLIPTGRASLSNNEMLTAADYEDLRQALRHYLSDPRGLVQGHYLVERAEPTRIQLPFARHGCSAGHRGMVILPNGKIQTCGFLGPAGERHLGRVPWEPFSAIWRRLLESGHIESLREKLLPFNAITKGPCTNCLAIAISVT
jgi:MoaA/NifB/PqqE/SkfB family radical SAM enzyme